MRGWGLVAAGLLLGVAGCLVRNAEEVPAEPETMADCEELSVASSTEALEECGLNLVLAIEDGELRLNILLKLAYFLNMQDERAGPLVDKMLLELNSLAGETDDIGFAGSLISLYLRTGQDEAAQRFAEAHPRQLVIAVFWREEFLKPNADLEHPAALLREAEFSLAKVEDPWDRAWGLLDLASELRFLEMTQESGALADQALEILAGTVELPLDRGATLIGVAGGLAGTMGAAEAVAFAARIAQPEQR
ncbi:hypothetical protein IIA16_02165, partial [bacterium]|nr:hypothetical protein [bacterium]